MGKSSKHRGLVAFGKAALAGVAFSGLLGGSQTTFAELRDPSMDLGPGITALLPR